MATLGVKIEDILESRDFRRNLKGKLKKFNLAQLFVWLGIKFVNEKVEYVTMRHLRHELWASGNKSDSYCFRAMQHFVELGILKRGYLTRPGLVRKLYAYRLIGDPLLFHEFLGDAMETIKGGRGPKDEFIDEPETEPTKEGEFTEPEEPKENQANLNDYKEDEADDDNPE